MAVFPMSSDAADMARADAAEFAALIGSSICHGASTPAGTGDTPVHPGHAHDCVLCQLCASFAMASVMRSSPTAMQKEVAAIRFVLPAAGAGPPSRYFVASRPRAPPISL
jgi:hypothetical protein